MEKRIINPAYRSELVQVVSNSPFPSHLAMRLKDIDLDKSRVELTIGPNHIQPFGIVHGGVLATLIDTATFWAVWMRLPEDAGLVNIDLKLNYLKSVTSGRLIAEGRSIRAGRSISYAEADVKDGDGHLLAHGTSTLMVLPGKGIPLKAPKFIP